MAPGSRLCDRRVARDFFFDGKLDDRILVLGTNDKKDGGFGQIENGKGSLDKAKFEKGVGVLDNTFAVGLPPAQLFDDMDKLVSFVEKKEQVKSLTPEQVEAANELKSKQEATAEVIRGYTLDAKPGRFVVRRASRRFRSGIVSPASRHHC